MPKKENWEKIKDMSPEEAYKMKPDKVLERCWKYLVDRWFDDHYQVLHLHLKKLCTYMYATHIAN
jgi:hypothetical protein